MQIELPVPPAKLGEPMLDTGCISVVIPVHNGAAYLRQTLESVLNQSALPGEIIVVDDGSTDDTAAIAHSLGVRVLSQEKRGPAAARNAGTRAAAGAYIAYLDADDLWTEDKLAVQFAALAGSGHPAFSCTDFRIFDARGIVPRLYGLRSHPAFRRTVGDTRGCEQVEIVAGARPVLPDNYLLPSSLIARRADVLSVGGFDESIRIGLEDYELFLRLFRVVPAIIVMRPLLLYRRHDMQLTSKAIGMKTGFFEVQGRVAAAPERYPVADARYIAEATYLQHYRIGVECARIGEFDAAIDRFEQSLQARQTVAAHVAHAGARLCRSRAGQAAFETIRALWKSRPRRR